jgi:hypothetical protein
VSPRRGLPPDIISHTQTLAAQEPIPQLQWSDSEVVMDGNLITSRKPDDLPAFCREIVRALAKTPLVSFAVPHSSPRRPGAGGEGQVSRPRAGPSPVRSPTEGLASVQPRGTRADPQSDTSSCVCREAVGANGGRKHSAPVRWPGGRGPDFRSQCAMCTPSSFSLHGNHRRRASATP